MKFTESVFKAYDVRGLVDKELTVGLAEAIGRAFADFLPKSGSVVVGYDMRPDSVELAKSVREGLIKQGRDVIDIGRVSTDMIYFATGHLEAAGGAMVTASHNPGKYNGIKLCGHGAAGISITTGLAEIRDAIKADRYLPEATPGSITKRDVTEDWVNHALSFVDISKWKAFSVAVDAGNGMAGAILPHLEPKVPLVITPLYFELDGTFPNHPANPMVPENLRDLIKTIREHKLDFGIAFDGDGDRAFMVDETGKTVSGSIMAAILAEHFLQKYPGATILYNAICSRIVPETIVEHGGTPRRTKVGHSFIKADMRTYNAPFAGEHSGHYYFRENYHADSGLIAALVAIDVLNKSGLSLSQLAAKYEKYFDSGEINTEVADKTAKISELAARFNDGTQDRLDGLTVNYPDWWFNIRPSNTEPLLRLNVEANTPELMTQNRDELLRLIRD